MKVPEQIKAAAKELIDMFGSNFEYLGNRNGAEFYMFKFPDDAETGFPYVYQFENGEVLTITGFAALDAIDLFVK